MLAPSLTGGLLPLKTSSACTFQVCQSQITISGVSVGQPLSVDAITFYLSANVIYNLDADRFCQSTLSAYAKPFIPVRAQPHNPVVSL